MSYRKVIVHTENFSFFAVDIKSIRTYTPSKMSGGKPDEGNWAVAIGMADGTTFQFRCDDEQSMRAECQRIKTIWVGVVDEEIKEMDAKKNVQSTALNHVEKFVAEQRRTGEMDDIED